MSTKAPKRRKPDRFPESPDKLIIRLSRMAVRHSRIKPDYITCPIVHLWRNVIYDPLRFAKYVWAHTETRFGLMQSPPAVHNQKVVAMSWQKLNIPLEYIKSRLRPNLVGDHQWHPSVINQSHMRLCLSDHLDLSYFGNAVKQPVS